VFSLILKTGKTLEKWGDDQSKKLRKSMSTALKREGFLLSGDLKKEIRKGTPGGQSYPGLSSIARRGLNAKFSNRKPYTGLEGKRGKMPGGMIPIRYNADMSGKDMTVEVGMVDTKNEKISSSWKRIFEKQQRGFSTSISQSQREYLARRGALVAKRSRFRKHFFLRKGTTTFKTPARPVIDPFWQRWEGISMQRLSDNFHKKMRGERI